MFHSVYDSMFILDIFQVVCSAKDLKLDDIKKINIRLHNIGVPISLKKLKAAFISKFFIFFILTFHILVCI